MAKKKQPVDPDESIISEMMNHVSSNCYDEGGFLGIYDSDCKSFIATVRKHDQRKCDALQAKIDALMLEWCPDEMTADQRETWAAHQKKVDIDV